MNERRLAHIERIEWIRDIPGADNIELCGVLGWQCVIAKKDNFKVGDYVVYCEIDSQMPERPEYEFSKGKSVINPNVEREGVVVRCIENGKKLLSFKVINPDFLLEYNE